MKVLHLPWNVASQMQVTVQAQRKLGLEVRGLSGPSRVQHHTGLELLPQGEGRSWPVRGWNAARRHAKVLEAITWADVIHWHCGPALKLNADLHTARALGKKMFVEFWGSDIRDPETEMLDNPWFAEAWHSGKYECPGESRAGSRLMQQRFSRSSARLLIPALGMRAYVVPEFFPKFVNTAQRLNLMDYTPSFPAASGSRPLVVHAPTAPVAKGSPYILAAVERLRSELNFDFQLVQGMTAQEARGWIARCDVFVDQLIAGDYGVAAVEAMAFGKPVISYIKPAVRHHYPANFPVISADPGDITEVLRAILSDGPRRRTVGEASLAWVEEHHDAHRIAAFLAEYYQAA